MGNSQMLAGGNNKKAIANVRRPLTIVPCAVRSMASVEFRKAATRRLPMRSAGDSSEGGQLNTPISRLEGVLSRKMTGMAADVTATSATFSAAKQPEAVSEICRLQRGRGVPGSAG